MKLVTAAEMRDLEQRAFAAGATPDSLMQNAGRAVALAVRDHFGNVRARRIVVLVGPGNNGGDGLVAARHLSSLGASVVVCLLTGRPPPDPHLEALRTLDVEIITAAQPDFDAAVAEALERADAVIDAVLGTGPQRPLDGVVAGLLDSLKDRRAT